MKDRKFSKKLLETLIHYQNYKIKGFKQNICIVQQVKEINGFVLHDDKIILTSYLKSSKLWVMGSNYKLEDVLDYLNQ